MPKIVLEFAHQEVIQKPKYIANAWSPIIDHLKSYAEFKNVESLKEMYSSKKPTRPYDETIFRYRAPDLNVEVFEHFEIFLHKAEQENKDLIITGDLNCNLLLAGGNQEA